MYCQRICKCGKLYNTLVHKCGNPLIYVFLQNKRIADIYKWPIKDNDSDFSVKLIDL
jgi:hypothetical protein